MNPDSADVPLVRLSTDAFPPNRRLAMWREVYDRELANFYGREIGTLDIDPLSDEPFRAGVTLLSLPGLGIASGYRSDARYHRPRDHAVRSSDNLVFAVVTNGVVIYSQLGREMTVGVGEAVLMSATEPSISTVRSDFRLLTLSVPRGAISAMMPDIESVLMRPIPPHVEALRSVENLTPSAHDGTSSVLRHLKRYVGMLMEPGGLMDDPALTEHVETTICDLLNLVLGATGDMAALARLRGLRAARCAEILKEIARDFVDPAFSVQIVATKLGVTPSYIQRLLRDTDLSFSERVLELRLQKARCMLSDRRNNHLKVSEIALACGFNEVSYFNRCFRRRYGDAPLGYRGK